MRRRHREENSLDLLLDTICNVFGGIVFIAILVALLTTARTHDVDAVREETAAHVELRREYERLGEERERYANSLAQLEATHSVLEEGPDAEQRRQLIEDISELTREISEAEETLRATQEWLEHARRASSEHEAAIEEALADARAMLSELRIAQAELDRRHEHEARLHRARRTQKRQVIFLLSGDAVYLVPYGHFKHQAELAGIASHVRLEEIDEHSQRAHPVPARGMAIDRLADHPDMQRLLEHAETNRHFFDIFVQDDAVEAYEALRRLAVELGYDYNVTPTNERPVTFTTTRQPRPVQ